MAGKRHLAWFLVVALAASSISLVLGSAPAGATTTTVVVHPGNPNGWGFLEEVPVGAGAFVEGPGTPPLSGGSAELTVDGTGREILATINEAGVLLANITRFEYSTYRDTFDAGNNLAVSLQFDVDNDATDGDNAFKGRLVFEPYLQAPGGVVEDTWQTWDTLTGPAAGYWWASQAPINATCPQANPCTWAEVLAAYPNARVRVGPGIFGALLLRAGGPWTGGFTGNVDNLILGVLGDDKIYDFEPSCALACYVNDATGNDMFSGSSPAFPKKTIQAAIDSAVAGGTISVYPGSYDETATNRFLFDSTGPYQFGLFVAKDDLTLQGVDGSGTPITSSAGVLARVDTNATNNFGPSGIWVEGDGVTIRGLQVGTNASGQNKTIEVIGDDFSLLDSDLDDPGGSLYFNDWRFNVPGDTSYVQSYTIDGNVFAAGSSIDLASGAGYSGVVGGRQITGNEFTGGDPTAFRPAISFNGSGTGVPWFVHSVGGAVISGNTFGGRDQYIRARGTYNNSQFAWPSYFTDNSYERAAMATPNLLDARTFSYVSGSYTFNDVRRVGGTIQAAHAAGCAGNDCNGELTNALAGDTVLLTGTFGEQVSVDKAITLDGDGTATTTLDGPGSGTGVTMTGGLTGVTVRDLTVTDYLDGITMPTGPLTNVTLDNLAVDANGRHGIWSQAFGVTNLTVNMVHANGNGTPANFGRGIWIINGTKTNVSVTNGEFSNNGLVGIDVSDGSVTGLLISGNDVVGNGDSGIAVLGAVGPAANLVTLNTVTDNGRFGVEIKNSTGNGALSGPGSLVVFQNTVTRTGAASDARDHAGIAVIRRSPVAPNPAQPSGAAVIENTVNGYHRAPVSTGDGFGIVVEGTGNVVRSNTITDNDVGVQVQGANPLINQQSTDFFDRGDAATGDGDVERNAIAGNSVGLRVTGTASATADCNWWGSASGPSGAGPGTGDSISAGATFSPWLLSSNLNGPCPAGPTLSIGDTALYESSTNQWRTLRFNVTLSQPATVPVTVQYATAPGSATVPADYQNKTGTLTFKPGQVVRPVAIKVWADTIVEGDHSFTVSLANVTNGYLGRSLGTATIIDDESVITPWVRLSNVSVVEGNTKNRAVLVTLNANATPGLTGQVVVTLSTTVTPGTASGTDFTSFATKTVKLYPQNWKPVAITLKPDTTVEPNETIVVTITSVTGPYSGVGQTGVITIIDDD
jgi:hypothetical protein